ncbi:MAG: hypothetical protein RLZZ546_1244 [Bacteroidota bacterium]|jgi:hypothetical protein
MTKKSSYLIRQLNRINSLFERVSYYEKDILQEITNIYNH